MPDQDHNERLARLEERDKSQNRRLSAIERSVGRIETYVSEMRTDMHAAKKAGRWLFSIAVAVGAILGAGATFWAKK